MPNRNYQRGIRFEREVKASLEAQGYTVVRSAGSRSIVDLTAFTPYNILMIQCKSSKNEMTKRQIRSLFKESNLKKLRLIEVPPSTLKILLVKDKTQVYTYYFNKIRWVETENIIENQLEGDNE